MTCQEPFKEYLDYECYHKLNDRFILGNLNVASSVTDFSSKHEVSYTKNSTLFNQILPKLKKYLSDDSSFLLYNQLYICKYISYLLYDEICKGDSNVCDENMFNTFKNFVERFYEDSRYDKCGSKIKLGYLDNSTYKKHSSLYDLYDKYNILIGQITSTQYIPCSTLHSLTFHYNEALRSHGESDVNFIDKLIELKKLIEAKVLQSKTDCGRNLPHFNETNIEKARAKELAEKQLREAAEAEKQKQIREAAEAEKQKKIREAAEAAQQQQQQRILSRPDDEITIVPSQRQALKSLPQGPYEESGAYRQPELAEGLTSEDEKSNEIDEQLHGPKNVWGTSPGGEEGIMVTMKNAISGFMNEVEPAPILGVSGGMGALFLLFKYTPVGTFFRGGRRINNRIPRTFYGQFAGGPAGYDDFYEGGFGPGPINIAYRPELE
ncbi:PIR protein [Plasmodium vivax]|nr:PIR protein [Plasmodium vivax]